MAGQRGNTNFSYWLPITLTCHSCESRNPGLPVILCIILSAILNGIGIRAFQLIIYDGLLIIVMKIAALRSQ